MKKVNISTRQRTRARDNITIDVLYFF